MIEEFYKHIARVNSVNMLNLAIIDALNVMTPTEVITMTEAIHDGNWRFPGDVPDDRLPEFTRIVREAVGQTVRAMFNAGKHAPEFYGRYMLTDGIRIFAGDNPAKDRVLIVAFPGNGGRLMMPLPIILQHLSPRVVDLVMVPDWNKANYRKGIPPLADTVEEGIAKLKEHLPRGYGRVVTFGTSSGGIPSLLAAPVVDADTVLAVGAGKLDDERWEGIKGQTKRGLMEVAAPGLDGRKVALAYGAQSPDDAASAAAIKALVPHSSLVEVALPGLEVKHVALYPLMQQSRLKAFFDEHFDLRR